MLPCLTLQDQPGWALSACHESSGLLHPHGCQSHLNPASPIDIFRPFICLFTFLMAFSFSLCRAKTQTALHTPETAGNLFTLKMSSVLQKKTNKVSSVSSTSSGRSVREQGPFFQRAPCAGLLGEDPLPFTQSRC